jgi:NADH:ubiquinone oxidoreductase subunit E
MTCKPTYTLEQDILEFIEECMQKEHSESYLIAVLHKVQGRHGYLSEIHMDEVAHLMQIPTSTVFGVATFYHYFKLVPKGKYSISVCMGTACFVKGADQVLKTFKNELGIDMGETSADGIFSLEGTRCIGVCALAPVVTINEHVYSKVTATEIPDILRKIRTEDKNK